MDTKYKTSYGGKFVYRTFISIEENSALIPALLDVWASDLPRFITEKIRSIDKVNFKFLNLKTQLNYAYKI